MRIIGGTFRGKNLNSPLSEETRPTSDRARESLFNLLNNYVLKSGKSWADLTFADVFAGTGAVGIEAVSRGTAHAYFFENNPQAIKVLNKNLMGIQNVTVYRDALKPAPIQHAVDFLFMDAPYALGLWEKALPAFIKSGWADKNTIVVIETDKAEKSQTPQGFIELDRRSYGRNTFMFLKKEEK